MDKEAYFTRGQEIVRRLNELTYEAYFVGGVVRDYLLEKDFTDIDIATSATPEQIYQEFPTVDMTVLSLFIFMKNTENFFKNCHIPSLLLSLHV